MSRGESPEASDSVVENNDGTNTLKMFLAVAALLPPYRVDVMPHPAISFTRREITHTVH